MPWGRLDDKANANPKLRLLSDAAWRMWGCGLIYCQDNLTDGFIPEGMVYEFGVKARNIPAIVQELLGVKIPGKGPLWHRDTGGYRVHDYHDWNDHSDTVRRERQMAKDRLQRHRERRRNGARNAVSHTVQNGAVNDEETASVRTSTYHVPQEYEKQERSPGSPTLGRILQHRRRRSRETDDGRPKVATIAALARDVLASHPEETDEGELREHVKAACAEVNLRYDGQAIGLALERATAQRRKVRSA